MRMKRIASHQIMNLFSSDKNDNEPVSNAISRINNEDSDCKCSVYEIFPF